MGEQTKAPTDAIEAEALRLLESLMYVDCSQGRKWNIDECRKIAPLTLEINRLKFAAGFGGRYLSPIGPVRMDFAYRISEDPDISGRWQFYLSLGQAF